MSTTKITQKMMFNALKSFIGEGEQVTIDGIDYTEKMVLEFIDGQIEKLDKKNSHKSKADLEKVEKANVLLTHIKNFLTDSKGEFSASEISLAMSDVMKEYISSQRVTPQLTKLVNNGIIVKSVNKGKTTYKLA